MHNWPPISRTLGATYDYSLCYSSHWRPEIGKWTQHSCLPVPKGAQNCQCVFVDSWGRMMDGVTFTCVYLCIPHVIHRSIHHINTPSAKCIYHLSVCDCHGSSCWGSRELGHADASSVSMILISCVTTHLSIHSSTHSKAMMNRSINVKNTFHVYCVQRYVLKYTITW